MRERMEQPVDHERDLDGVPLRVRLLGNLELHCEGGRTSAFESDKARALLAYLLLHARPLRREHLAGLLWGEWTERRARGNLSRVLTNLRHLMPGYLLSDRHTVQFDAERPHWVDVKAFEAHWRATEGAGRDAVEPLRAAIALYRGDFMEGFSLAGCPDFEEWVVILREHLRRRVLKVLNRLVEHHSNRGEYDEALRYARRSLHLEPWRETTHRRAISLLSLLGERSRALAQYEECRKVLKDELGVEPAKETQILYERLLNEGLEVEGDIADPAGDFQLPFIGRARPRACLRAFWSAARRREGGLTLVEGEAGAGKTRLVEEVLRPSAQEGVLVLRGRCYEFSRAVPYQAILDALRPCLGEFEGERGAALPEEVRAELLRLDPERFGKRPSPGPRGGWSAEARRRFFESVAYLLGTLTEGTLTEGTLNEGVLFLDDLHWADPDTLDLLHYVVRALTDKPLWIVGTYRPEETTLDHPLTRLRQGLSRDGCLHHVSLIPLSPDDVAALVTRSVLGDEKQAFAEYLFAESEGNPFILTEVFQTLEEVGVLKEEGERWQLVGDPREHNVAPQRVQDVVMQRVGRLSREVRWLLNFAAVFGHPFEPNLLAGVAGKEETALSETLAVWQERRLLNRQPSGAWDFTHDKIRETVYESLSLQLRKLLHERVGQGLLDQVPEGETVPDDDLVGRIAYHFERCLVPRRAAPFLRQAAEGAERVYAHQAAIGYYHRLLPLVDRGERGEVLHRLATIHHHLGNWEEAAQLSEKAVRLAVKEDLGLLEVRALCRLATTQEFGGDAETALRTAQRAAARAEALGPDAYPELVEILSRQGWGLFRLDRVDEALPLVERALDLSRRLDRRKGIADSLNLLSAIHNRRGEYALGAECLREALAIFRATSNRIGETQMLINLGYTAYQRGDYESAVAHCEEALPVAHALGDRYLEMLALTNCGGARAALRSYAAAERDLRRVLEMVEAGKWTFTTETYRYLAEALLGQGREEEALDAARRSLTLAEEAKADGYAAAAWQVMGRVLARVGGTGEEGLTPQACFARSRDAFAALEMDGERARTLWAWARYEFAQGDEGRGRELLGEARRIAERLGIRLDG